jgi:hypothetical protein
MEQVKGAFSTWKGRLVDEIKKKVADDYVVLVEEKTNHVARYGTQFLFDEMHQHEEEINLYVALKFYFQMLRSGDTQDKSNIVIKPEFKRWYIQEALIEIDRDDKGRPKFNVAWDQLAGGHRCVLMAVMAAHRETVNERFLKVLFGEETQTPPDNPIAGLHSIMRHKGHFGYMESN